MKKADPFYSRSKVNDQTGQLVSQTNHGGYLVYNPIGDCDQRAMTPLDKVTVHSAFSAHTENSSGSNPFREDVRDSRQFAVLKNYDPKRGDLIYGLKTQQTSCIKKLFKGYEPGKCPRATINEYTDLIVKAITEANSNIAAASATMANIAADIIAAKVVDIPPLKPYIYRNFGSYISGYTKYIERNHDNYNYVEPINQCCDQIIERITTTIEMIQSGRVSANTMQSSIKTLKSDVKNIVINALIAQNASLTFPKQLYKNWFLTISSFNKDRNFLWEEFFAIAEKNKKFDIVEIYKETIQNYKKSRYHKWLPSKHLVPSLLFKRISKLGIEIVAQGNNKLHYHLDGINIAAITKKYQFEGNSISASELRYLFRKRYHSALPFNVIFYKNNSEVTAPWIDSETAAFWEEYRPKSMVAINCQR